MHDLVNVCNLRSMPHGICVKELPENCIRVLAGYRAQYFQVGRCNDTVQQSGRGLNDCKSSCISEDRGICGVALDQHAQHGDIGKDGKCSGR